MLTIITRWSNFIFCLSIQPLFAFEVKEDYGDDGWKVYDPIAEYKRQV